MGHQATRPLTCPIPPILFSPLRCNYPGTRHGWKCRMMDLEAPHLVVDAYQKPSAPVEQSRSISGEIWGHGCPPSLPLFRPQRFPAKPFRPIRPNSLHRYHGPTVCIFSARWIALDECRGYELWWVRWYQGIWLNMKVKEHDRLLKICPIFCCLPRLSHIFFEPERKTSQLCSWYAWGLHMKKIFICFWFFRCHLSKGWGKASRQF